MLGTPVRSVPAQERFRNPRESRPMPASCHGLPASQALRGGDIYANGWANKPCLLTPKPAALRRQ